jgi:hypothetical protein
MASFQRSSCGKNPGRQCVCFFGLSSWAAQKYFMYSVTEYSLLFFLLVSKQELLHCWMLVHKHRCNSSKAGSHPVHHNMLNQCVPPTAKFQRGGQDWVEVATWIVKCCREKIMISFSLYGLSYGALSHILWCFAARWLVTSHLERI